MRRLPADMVILRQLHSQLDGYIAILNFDVAKFRKLIVECELLATTGLSDGLERSLSEIAEMALPLPPGLVERYMSPVESADSELSAAKIALDQLIAKLKDGGVTERELGEFASISMKPFVLVRDECIRDGERIQEAIECVADGKPIRHWPPKPVVVLPKLQTRLFDAVWENADWSKPVHAAPVRAVVLAVWDDEEHESRLKQRLSKLNDSLLQKNVGVSFARRGDVIEIEQRKK